MAKTESTLFRTAQEAVSVIQSAQRVFIQGSAATPLHLTRALGMRASELKNVELVSLTTLGEMNLLKEEYPDSFYINSLFVSANTRDAVNDNRGDYIPVFLSEIPKLFYQQVLPLDVALIHVSPPDRHGFCSLGVSVDISRSALKHARCVIAQVNPRMPRTHGDGMIHIREIDIMVECSDELPEVHYSEEISEEELRIGYHCASIIEDGSTLQMGIGAIPDAVMKELSHHKDLGVHTEMFSNGVIDLLQKGVITNRFKKKHRRKVVSTFAIGNRALYDFIDDNPEFEFLESDYVNDTYVIAKNPKVAAINSAIEIDLTGQVCADSIGMYQFSGVGGQMDFIRGANLSEGGKPIIAMRSTTHTGDSKIVPMLKPGASVVTTRAHVHYVVTEYGIANLFGKNLKQRAYALIDIAHPAHRDLLEKEAFQRFGPK
ncbi:MAG TPA: acetyl-CoA hydrolase/transferase C-terminal domain-containing protein [Chitinophagaceae bacterium]|nr:acetyl-CoA hydrolase/transferase C-terminal domain-containing protein [Chitinophagaceae bacterium]HNF71509.1 acetyl-CoA hydrolase/transferase C-terminal domain-containing protein [Chitinophagaceae bacterium]